MQGALEESEAEFEKRMEGRPSMEVIKQQRDRREKEKVKENEDRKQKKEEKKLLEKKMSSFLFKSRFYYYRFSSSSGIFI